MQPSVAKYVASGHEIYGNMLREIGRNMLCEINRNMQPSAAKYVR